MFFRTTISECAVKNTHTHIYIERGRELHYFYKKKQKKVLSKKNVQYYLWVGMSV